MAPTANPILGRLGHTFWPDHGTYFRTSLQVKDLFFNKPQVIVALNKTNRKVLSNFGALVRKIAQRSMRPGGKKNLVSKPGEPPRTHKGLLKKRLYYSYSPATQSVVVGPTSLYGVGKIPPLMEYGGTTPARPYKAADLQLGGFGPIAVGGKRGRTVATPKGTVNVVYVKLTSDRMVARAQRLHASYQMGAKKSARYAPRPFMAPAFRRAEDELPRIWAEAQRS
jgi:hypothetical protein